MYCAMLRLPLYEFSDAECFALDGSGCFTSICHRWVALRDPLGKTPNNDKFAATASLSFTSLWLLQVFALQIHLHELTRSNRLVNRFGPPEHRRSSTILKSCQRH